MASTAKSGIPGVSSNVKMRLQKWVGRATVVGKQKIERDERMHFEPTTNACHGNRSGIAMISTKMSKPIPVSKVGKHFSSRDSNTSVSYPTSLIHSEAEESSAAYHKGNIPSSMDHGARIYGSTGNLTSVHMDRELGKASKRNRQWPRFMSKESSSKKHKARSTDDLSLSNAQTDINHNKRAAFQANKLKRTRQTSNDSSETLSSDSDRQNSSFATSLEEPDEELDSTRTDVEKLSEQINARLQQWVNLAEGKQERRHSEDSTASSSDYPDGSPATQAKEIRELESALKELVGNATYNVRARRLSRCDLLDGTNSANSAASYTAPDLSLLGRAKQPSETTEAGCLETKQAEKRPHSNALPGKQESGYVGSSSTIRCQETSGEYAKSEVTKDSCERHARRDRVSSSDSGLSLEMEISAGKKQRYSEKSLSPKTSNSSDGAGETSGLRETTDTVTSDEHSDPRSGDLVVTRELQEAEICKPPDVSERGKETNAQPSSPSGGSKVRFEIGGEFDPKKGHQIFGQQSKTSETQSALENANIRPPVVNGCEMETSSKGNGPRMPRIMKRSSAPTLVYSLKMRADVRESMRQFLNFNDTGLSEFAVECVRHANKKKQRIHKINSAGLEESCSESDDNTNDKAAATSAGEPDAGPKELNNISQNASPDGDGTLTSLSEKPAINTEDREFAKTAEEAEKILATSGICSVGSALPRRESDSLRSQAGLPPRLYKFPSLPMFYCPDGTNEEAEKRPQQTRSDRPLSLYANSPSLKKCNSTTNLYSREGDLDVRASRVKNRGRLSLPVSNIFDPFFHGSTPRTDKTGANKTGKQKRAGRRLIPRTWFGKLKDQNDNIQKSEKKLSLLLKSKSKEQNSSVNVSMEALI